MCSRTTCRSCGKPTWSGCGAHIEQALAGVPQAERCRCREEKAAASAKKPEGKRWFGLFG